MSSWRRAQNDDLGPPGPGWEHPVRFTPIASTCPVAVLSATVAAKRGTAVRVSSTAWKRQEGYIEVGRWLRGWLVARVWLLPCAHRQLSTRFSSIALDGDDNGSV